MTERKGVKEKREMERERELEGKGGGNRKGDRKILPAWLKLPTIATMETGQRS
jgi:hypothetical protein